MLPIHFPFEQQILSILNNTLLPTLSEELLKALSEEKEFTQVSVDLNTSNEFEIKISNLKQKTLKNKTKKREKTL